MSKQLEAKPLEVNSPAELLRILDSEYTLTNDEVVIAVLETTGFLQPTTIHSIHTNAVIDSGMPTVNFYETVADYLRDEDDDFAIVTVRGRDRSFVDSDEIQEIFSEHSVLDAIQVDWKEKTWASDMCGDPSCCDQSMTQSFLISDKEETEEVAPLSLKEALQQLGMIEAVEESK